ncbi:hypothetical protein KXS11_08875 [Plantibacter flavus]|uniref:hypothetical protein n=1 Tax=Plantibacter flavus TaxID=150123 RepID=UPI003F148EA1
MSDARRTELRRRYLSLGLGELVAAAVFAGFAALVLTPRLDGTRELLSLWSALTPLLIVLVQAGVYWLLARGWVERATMPPTLASVYRAFRVLNVAILAAGLIGVVVWFPEQPLIAALTVFVWAFGVVEYVNYFAVRLAYPAGAWLRRVGTWQTPRLVQDLRSAGQ